MDIEIKNMKVAWGITGSGDDIKQILDTMKHVKERYDQVDIRVYVSKSGEQVLRMYFLWDELTSSFNKVQVEKSPNTPFLAGELQSGKYDFFIIAPTTSNTTAKIALGLGDSMISNAVNMATKAGVPVYILPCEIGEASTETVLPDERVLNLRIRKIDSDHIKSLEAMESVHVLRDAQEIIEVFEENYF
jgi:archaeoflavoprotein AfpA